MRTSLLRLDADTAGVLRRYRTPIAIGFVLDAAALFWWVGARPVLPALLVFGLLATALSVCDIRLLRLPDALTLPGYPLLAGLLLIPFDTDAYPRALIAMAAAYAGHLALALAGVGVGLGDVLTELPGEGSGGTHGEVVSPTWPSFMRSVLRDVRPAS